MFLFQEKKNKSKEMRIILIFFALYLIALNSYNINCYGFDDIDMNLLDENYMMMASSTHSTKLKAKPKDSKMIHSFRLFIFSLFSRTNEEKRAYINRKFNLKTSTLLLLLLLYMLNK